MRKLGRLIAAAGLVAGILAPVTATVVTVAAQPASAAVGSACTGYSLGGDSWAISCGSSGSSSGGSGGSGGNASGCTLYSLAQAAQKFGLSPQLVAQYQAPPGYIYLVQYCPGAYYYNFAFLLYIDGGTLTTQDLAQQAYAELSPPTLTVGTAPPSGRDGLVGLPEWFWIASADYTTISRTVALAGLSATVTAKPGPLVIDPGNGGPSISCAGPGTPYNPSEPAASQQSDCTYLYTRPSAGQPGNAYSVTISVSWTATWTGTGGTGGTLAPITRTTTILLPIAQAETVYTGD